MTRFTAHHALFAQILAFFDQTIEDARTGVSLDQPPFALRRAWEFWIRASLSASARTEFEHQANDLPEPARQELMEELHKSLVKRFGSDDAARLAFLQLAEFPVFQSWRALDSYRRDRAKATNAIVLHRAQGGTAEDVVSLSVFLLPRKPDDPIFRKCGFESDDEAFANVYPAIRSLLFGPGLFRLLVSASFLQWSTPYRVERTIVFLGWSAVLSGLSAIFFFGSQLAPNHLIDLLTLILAACGVLLLRTIIACLREANIAYRASRLMAARQLCVVTNMTRANDYIRGSSFGFPLAIEILSSLLNSRELSAGSWLWRPFINFLNAHGRCWAFSGNVQAGGLLGPVQRVRDKLEACLDHPLLRHFVIPVQGHELPAESFRPAWLGEGRGGAAATPTSVRLHRSWHLTGNVFRMAGGSSPAAALASLFAFASVLILLLAHSEIGRILSSPPPVTLEPDLCSDIQELPAGRPPGFPARTSADGASAFRLVFRTNSESDFRLKLNDRLPLIPLSRNAATLPEFHADVRIADLTAAFGPDPNKWEFLLVRPLSFLGRPLVDEVILRIPYVGLHQGIDPRPDPKRL